ncbi:hypothetical protein AAVH_32423, partial [Aphelenchoides avenae]
GNGKRVELQFESHTPGSINECRNDCIFGGTDVKFNDITRGGARVCCPEHVQEFGTVTSTSDLMIVRVCSIRNSQKSKIKFRTTDAQGPPGKPVPPRGGVAPSLPSGGGGGGCTDSEAVCDVARKTPAACRDEILGDILRGSCPCLCGSG